MYFFNPLLDFDENLYMMLLFYKYGKRVSFSLVICIEFSELLHLLQWQSSVQTLYLRNSY
jgi:hypothetical protein